MRKSKVRVWIAIGLAVLTISACGDDSGSDTASNVTTTTAVSSATTGPTATVATGPNTPAPKPLATRTKVTATVPFNGIEAFVQIPLAQAMGEFEKENIEVDLQTLGTTDAIVQLQSKRIWMTPAGISAGMLNAISAGSDLAMVGSLSGFNGPPTSLSGFWAKSSLVGADGKMDPCAFKGKTVSFGGPSGLSSTSSLYFANFVKACNLTINDVKLSTLGGTDLLVALQSGAVDVGNLSDPTWKDPAEKGYAKLVIPFGNQATGGIVMGPLRKEQPEVADAIMRALVRTTRTYLQGDYHKNPTVRPVLLKVLGVPEATLDAVPSLPWDPNMRFVSTFDADIAKPLQQIWIDAKLTSFSTPVTGDKYLDMSILNRVAPAR